MKTSVTADVETVRRIDAVPAMLQVICETTGMRFAAVARVTDDAWIACAVKDSLDFGLEPGGELDLATTLCNEIRSSHQTVIIDKASEDPLFCNHHTPRLYQFESYISVPVFRTDGSFFGTLCALDPLPVALKASPIAAMVESFAKLFSVQLETEENHQRTQTALSEAGELAEQREQFIAMLGHDLRNPLFAISAGAQMLKRRTQDEKSLAILDHILASERRAGHLVEDVLDFARGSLGAGIPLKRTHCDDLTETLLQVVDEIERVHPEPPIQADFGDLPSVYCDRERLGQVFSNLLANAILHGSSRESVQVRAAVEHETFVLSVVNQGVPIPATQLTQLFKPFTRLDPHHSRRGLGLGLYIAERIAEAHGGTLTVRSDAATGTCFALRIPRSAALAASG